MDVHVVVNRMARSPKRYSLNRKANEKHSFPPKPGVRFAEDQRPREHHGTSSPSVMIHIVQDTRNVSPNLGTLNDRLIGHSTGVQRIPQPVTMAATGLNAIPVLQPGSPAAVYGNTRTTPYNPRYNDALKVGQNDLLTSCMNRAQPTRNPNIHGAMYGHQAPSHNFLVKNGARVFSSPGHAQGHFPPYAVPNTPTFHAANQQTHAPRQQFYYHGNHYPGNSRQFHPPQHAAYNPYMEGPCDRGF